MKKEPKVENRETKIEKARLTLKEVPTATKVKAWTFQIEKQFYVIISFFAPRFGQQMSVYFSNRKGIKTSNVEIDHINQKDDVNLMFEQVIRKLIPEDVVPEALTDEERFDEATVHETERYQASMRTVE